MNPSRLLANQMICERAIEQRLERTRHNGSFIRSSLGEPLKR